MSRDFDPVSFAMGKAAGGGGGGGDITVESLSVTENGIYTASSGKAYSPVTVNVPSDTPTLITKSVTENGTYDADDDEADGYSSVTVDVPEATLTTKSITANGTYAASVDNADGYSSVTVNVSGGELPEAEAKDVNFIDYDGKILYSYTAQEAAALETMPANPSHTGLTAQGWNYTLAQMKAEVTALGKCNIGQMYTTDDGKTRVYIHLETGRLSPTMGFAINGTAVIDWGDGSQTDTVTGTSTTTVKNTNHAYAAAGDYIITITITGTLSINGNSTVGSRLMYDGATSGNAGRVYRNAVREIEIGNNVGIGDYAFQNFYSLASVTISSGVTSIGSSAFQNCYSLSSVTIPSGVTSIGSSAFSGCHGLASVTIPSSMTSIGDYALQNCYSLSSVTIPSGVTSIGSSAFSGCHGLASVTIPSSMTSIGSSAFSNCYGLAEIHFKSATPPSVSNSNAWSNVPTDCKIYVPAGELSAYTGETNYPSSSRYTYVEE